MPAPGHEPFLRAICENPDDDAPRLIYADWLDENGDADRAEFIRLQIGTGDSDAVEVLKRRLRVEELFNGNHRHWIGDLPGAEALWSEVRVDEFYGTPANWLLAHGDYSGELTWVVSAPCVGDWERGFPAAVYIQSSGDLFFSCIQEIGEFVPVHRVRLQSLRDENGIFVTLAKSAFLKKIRELIVPPDVILTDATVTLLANSPFVSQLRQLSLVAELLNDSTGMALATSPFLRDIDMLHLLRSNFSEKVLAALRTRYGFRVHC